MASAAPARIATLRVDVDPASHSASEASGAARLIEALLAGSPRVTLAGSGVGRVDARGWERRGGEGALARTLLGAAAAAGLRGARVGVADVAVAADAAALLAAPGLPSVAAPGVSRSGAPGIGTKPPVSAVSIPDAAAIIVPPEGARRFLAPLPLALLPLSGELEETLRSLGLRRVGELAALPREEVEARLGPEGVRVHRLACGEDGRSFRPLRPEEPPEASLELEGGVETAEPLLFALRGLVDRVCGGLAERGTCAARLQLLLRLEDGSRAEATVVPARPTRRASLLYDLCRAALERGAWESGARGKGAVLPSGGAGSAPLAGRPRRASAPLPAAVEEVVLRVSRLAPPGARQGDLFTAEWRDPMEAAAALLRLQARLGEAAVARPLPRPDHRPERRSGWVSVGAGVPHVAGRLDPTAPSPSPRSGAPPSGSAAPPSVGAPPPDPLPGALRLLPVPLPVQVRTADGRPVEVEDGGGRHTLVAAEGPERLSGDWWRDPYRREYYRACTAAGELLWIFREYRPRGGELRWWLHGWWD